MTTHKLILWDIDHTLIETGGVGSEVFRDAFEQATGRKIDKMADVTGRTEPIIFHETLELYGIEDPGDYFPKFLKAQAEGYRNRADEMRCRGRVLPGARQTLEAFADVPGVAQTILTGNPRISAEIKLKAFDLIELLDINSGAYGTDNPVRSNLVAIAQRRAAERYGVSYNTRTTVVIGDTTSDVEAALMGGAQIIAIASGQTSSEDLRASGAPVVLESLENVAGVIGSVVGSA